MKRPVLTCTIAALLLGFAAHASLAQQADTFSQVVSYQYQDSLANPGAETQIISPVVSYQYYDWVGDENVTFTNSPNVSYRYDGPPSIRSQPAGRVVRAGDTVMLSVTADGSPPLTYRWRLNGVALNNTNSSAIQIPNAQPANSGAYSVVVSNGYAPAAVSADAQVLVFLSAPGATPTPPPVVPAGSPLPPSLTAPPVPPTNAQLKWYNRNSQQFEDISQSLVPGRITIVVTHGWKSSSEGWPTAMARALSTSAADVQILAWDWRANADKALPSMSANRTPSEGEALGNALISTLGSNYSRPLHFLGHSLGALVNCAAADYLHGDTRHQPPKTPAAFPSGNTHVTLFDEAEIAVPLHGLYVTLGVTVGSDPASDARVVPSRAAYVDNYVSEVGVFQSNVLNVMLWRRLAIPGINDFIGNGLHGYAYEWYRRSVQNPLGSTVGYRWSFERNSIGPMSQLGTYYLQSLNVVDSPLKVTELNQTFAELMSRQRLPSYAGLQVYRAVAYPTYQSFRGISAIGSTVQGIYLNGIQYAGNVLANFVETLHAPASQPVYMGTAGSTPAYYVSSGNGNSNNSSQAFWDLNFTVQAAAPAPSQLNVPMTATGRSSGASNDPSVYTITPIHVPREALGVSFEYKIEGASDSDFMTMGIGDVNYYTMEAHHVGDGQWIAVPVIDVTNLRDQDVQLAFALNGSSGPPTGMLSIRNIQFFVPPKPELELSVRNDEVTVSWPLSAIGWTLEANQNLGGADGWGTVNVAPTATDYFHSVTLDITGEQKFFFRLRK